MHINYHKICLVQKKVRKIRIKYKKELYTTLYQKDAACRVIARQLKEIENYENCKY